MAKKDSNFISARESRKISKANAKITRELDKKLKRECQQKFEESHSHDEFMRIIKRNYL